MFRSTAATLLLILLLPLPVANSPILHATATPYENVDQTKHNITIAIIDTGFTLPQNHNYTTFNWTTTTNTEHGDSILTLLQPHQNTHIQLHTATTEIQALEALQYINENNQNQTIIAMSFGIGDEPRNWWNNIIHELTSKNHILITSVGNKGAYMTHPITWPAHHEEILAIGSQHNNQTARYTSYNEELHKPDYVVNQPNNYQGTSYAVPLFINCITPWIQQHQPQNHTELRNLITKNSKDYHTPGWDQYTGYGQTC